MKLLERLILNKLLVHINILYCSVTKIKLIPNALCFIGIEHQIQLYNILTFST